MTNRAAFSEIGKHPLYIPGLKKALDTPTPLESGVFCSTYFPLDTHESLAEAMDATNGVVRTWLDGNEVTCKNSSGVGYPLGGDTHRNSAGWAGVYFASNWSSNPGWEHDASNHMYIDDFEVYSDEATGTAATGSMQDGTVTILP